MAEQQARGYVSTDPNFGAPIEARGYVSTDPNFGQPVEVKKRTWSDELGLNEPTDSMLTGFLRGSGGAAVDMAQGAVANIANRFARGGDPTTREVLGMVPLEQQEDVMQAPETFAASVGGVLPTVAEMAIPVGGATKAAYQAFPRVARASAKFQEVMGAAKNIPIETKAVGDAALRIQEMAERGGSMPMAVRKILNRMTDPAKAPMTYEEARDFASNISRLSANEYGRLTPAVAREVSQLRVALNEANAQAAKAAGKMDEYKSAMREYAQAMRIRDAVDTAIKGAKKALPAATVLGGSYWLTRELKGLLGGEQ